MSVKFGNNFNFLDTLHYMKAPLEEMINTYANRKENDDGSWDCKDEKLENFVLKKQALPIIYSDLTLEEISQIKIEKERMFYQDFSYDTFQLPDLPDIPAWYDPLKEKGITEEELKEEKRKFRFFHFRKRVEHIIKYAIDDVLHLADVWLGYVNLLLEKFHLDIGNFVSLPNFAWNALFLYLYPKSIENFKIMEMFDAIKGELEGGLSQTWNILSRSNDPRMKDYNPDKPTSNIMKVDENSLYASCMCMSLPISEWEEIDVKSKSLDEWVEFFRDIEEDINKNLTQEEKYKIMFENEPVWKQGEYDYVIWDTTDCSNPDYIKKWNEMSLLPIRRDIEEFSERNIPVAKEGKWFSFSSPFLHSIQSLNLMLFIIYN